MAILFVGGVVKEEEIVPVEKVSGKSHQIIVREVARDRIGLQMGLGLLGLGVIAGGIASGYLIDSATSLVVPLLVVAAVVGFGMASLMSWRRSGEFEVVEIIDGRLRLVNSKVRYFVFDAPIEQTKVQRVRHSLGMRLCLRDGVRAVEFGGNLPVKQRELLAQRIDAALETAKTSSP